MKKTVSQKDGAIQDLKQNIEQLHAQVNEGQVAKSSLVDKVEKLEALKKELQSKNDSLANEITKLNKDLESKVIFPFNWKDRFLSTFLA